MTRNGATTAARGTTTPAARRPFHLYSLGGCRRVTDDGWIVGTFTDPTGTTDKPPRPPRAVFFKFPA